MPITISIPEWESFDSDKGEFKLHPGKDVQFEHSLLSLSKWESKWHKPFLGDSKKSREEIADYIRCMCMTQSVDPAYFDAMTRDQHQQLQDYINDPMTATWFSSKGQESRDTITSEIIYYWMIAQNVPFDPCQKWHLNRLLTLIRVCGEKNNPPKKMSKRDMLEQRNALNAQRKAKYKTTG